MRQQKARGLCPLDPSWGRRPQTAFNFDKGWGFAREANNNSRLRQSADVRPRSAKWGLGPTAPAGPGQSPGLFLFLALALSACQSPPPWAYVSTHAAAKTATIPVGANDAGEACTQDGRPGDRSAAIYCGTWQQPSAHVVQATQGATSGIAVLAAGGVWRDELDRRLDCGAPSPTTTLGRFPAMVLACTSRQGGWPQVALVADAGGKTWL